MIQSDRAIRAFIALTLPGEVVQALTAAARELEARTAPRSVRWVKPDQMHLTLKFLGETPAAGVHALGEAVQRVAGGATPFPLTLDGLGAFPNPGRARVIWAGLGGDLQGLQQLFHSLEDTLGGLGIPREARPLVPHLTLGRVREAVESNGRADLSEALSQVVVPALSFEMADLVLFRSMLSRLGASYEPLARGVLRLPQ